MSFIQNSDLTGPSDTSSNRKIMPWFAPSEVRPINPRSRVAGESASWTATCTGPWLP